MRRFEEVAGEEREGHLQRAAVHECIGPHPQAVKVCSPKEGNPMKKQRSCWFVIVLALGIGTAILLSGCTEIWSPAGIATSGEGPLTTMAKKGGCTTIQSGELLYSAGHFLEEQPLGVGYDPYGYNYQAHMFRGSYANVYLGGAGLPPYDGDDEAYLAANPGAAAHWAWPYRDTQLVMKWNDAWLSSSDCDGDGKLDRHYGFDSYIGSGAWETNHQSGTYVGDDGKEHKWTYFVKIVAAPEDACADSGIWYTADGTEIGPTIWGSFATIQEVENDPEAGVHGIQYLSPAGPGFGKW